MNKIFYWREKEYKKRPKKGISSRNFLCCCCALYKHIQRRDSWRNTQEKISCSFVESIVDRSFGSLISYIFLAASFALILNWIFHPFVSVCRMSHNATLFARHFFYLLPLVAFLFNDFIQISVEQSNSNNKWTNSAYRSYNKNILVGNFLAGFYNGFGFYFTSFPNYCSRCATCYLIISSFI